MVVPTVKNLKHCVKNYPRHTAGIYPAVWRGWSIIQYFNFILSITLFKLNSRCRSYQEIRTAEALV